MVFVVCCKMNLVSVLAGPCTVSVRATKVTGGPAIVTVAPATVSVAPAWVNVCPC